MRSQAGRLDVLVSNVGADLTVPFLEMTLEEWDRVVNINLRASFVLGQIAARSMVADGRGGVILYTASISALGASTEDAHYGASKAGIVNLAKTMAIELVRHGIRVDSISPGPLDTPMSLALLGSEEAMQLHHASTGRSCPWAGSVTRTRSQPASPTWRRMTPPMSPATTWSSTAA